MLFDGCTRTYDLFVIHKCRIPSRQEHNRVHRNLGKVGDIIQCKLYQLKLEQAIEAIDNECFAGTFI